jgi:hypothetical protein
MLFVTHGLDDFRGGLCEITEVVDGIAGLSVRLRECPGWDFNWLYLMKGQAEWRDEYGERRGSAEPDDRPEFNEY